MSTPHVDQLHAYCQRLRLYQVAMELPTLLEQAAKQEQSYSDFLHDLIVYLNGGCDLLRSAPDFDRQPRSRSVAQFAGGEAFL